MDFFNVAAVVSSAKSTPESICLRKDFLRKCSAWKADYRRRTGLLYQSKSMESMSQNLWQVKGAMKDQIL